MRWTFVLLFALLAGCGRSGDEQAESNHGYGYHYDEQGITGTRVRYYDANTPRLATVEAHYRSVAECMRVDLAPGPLVIFQPGIFSSDHSPAFGFLDTSTLLNNSDFNSIFWMRHEMVHYLLDRSGFPRDRNQAHDSPFFFNCVQS